MERGELFALESIQHRLWRLITAPSGIETALEEEGDAEGGVLSSLVRGDRGVPPVARVAIYANAYFNRLHDCLRDDFGALARALGPAAFHDLIKTYAMIYPPAHPSLRHAGSRLADHLTIEPFAAIFARRCPYAADLARLEWAIAEAFYASDAPVVARDDLAAFAPEVWGALRFETTPSLQVFACGWPVQIARERFDREDAEASWNEAPALVREPTCLRVWRQEERVRYARITRLELEALGGLQSGEPFSALCDLVGSGVDEAGAAARAASFLSSWIADGLVARVLR